MRALVQLLAAVVTIAILWGTKIAVMSQGDTFAQGFGAGFLYLLVIVFLYTRFVGPLT